MDDRNSAGDPGAQASRARILEGLAANYPQVQYHFVQFVSEHLTDCARVFRGDMEKLLILAVLGQRYIEGARFDPTASDLDTARVWMSTLRLADVTGLPRETVRRKLKAMEADGWLRQERGKGWTLAGEIRQTVVREQFGELDRRGLERLARLLAALRPFLPEAETPPTPER